MNTNDKDKRRDIRIPLLSEYAKVISSNSLMLFASENRKIFDIGKNGCFIELEDNLQLYTPKQQLCLVFMLPGDLGGLTVDCQVVWRKWRKKKGDSHPLGIGVKFINMTSSVDKIFDAYLVYLRNKQIITVSKRIIEEFFGPKGPPK